MRNERVAWNSASSLSDGDTKTAYDPGDFLRLNHQAFEIAGRQSTRIYSHIQM